jgi:hypothetical protein
VQQLTRTTASALAAVAAIMLPPPAAEADTASGFEIASRRRPRG